MKRLGKLASYFFLENDLITPKHVKINSPPQDKIDFLNHPKTKTLKLKDNKYF